MAKKKSEVLAAVSNDAADIIAFEAPYQAFIRIEGVAPVLFHAWSCDSVAAKAAAKKGSAAKKSDDLESYVHRVGDGDNRLGIPGAAFHASLIEAGRYVSDPRSPRKSARDLIKAGIIVEPKVFPFEPSVKKWDYVDRRRVVIQRSAITRERPAMRTGWRVSFDVTVTSPEYIDRTLLQQIVGNAGRLVGLLDFRPTFGRFAVVGFDIR